MSSNIIKLFNKYYKIYLDNIYTDISYLYNSFINEYFKLINEKEYKYELYIYTKIKVNDYSHINNKSYKYNLNFNNNTIGFLLLNKHIINSTIDLFIQYLSILIYNTSMNDLSIMPISKQCIFNDILDMMTDGVIVCDNIFNIYMINIVAKNIISFLNIYITEYLNKKIFDIFSELEDILEINEIYKNKKINYRINKNTINTNLLIVINTILYEENIYYIIIINNEKNNEKINNDGFLSHELRNSLQTITFANHLIEKKIINNDIIDKQFKKYLDIINKSTYDMTKIINDILDIDRLESDKLSLKFENINIHDLIDDIKFDFSKYLTNANIIFDINLDKTLTEINYLFLTDITRIKQILINILTNAVKYSKPRETNKIILSISYNTTIRYINFSISDTGLGIKTENLNNILNNERNYTITQSNSNGLGLYICNRIAQLLGGIIKINSKYLEGTEFIFSHPLKINNNTHIIKKKLEYLQIKANLLLVDDDENMILLFKDIINNLKFNYNITQISIDNIISNDLLFDLVKINNYDMIFININMITINGISIIRLLRKNEYNNKIIAITSDINIQIDNTLYDGLLLKPYNENDILDKLKIL
jgi:signal transduction histidine kinase/CheY-like chemotaxis protein